MKKQQPPQAPPNKEAPGPSPAATPKKRPSLAPSSSSLTPKRRPPPSEVSDTTSRGRPPKLPPRSSSNANSPVPRLNRPKRPSIDTTTSLGAQADVSSIGSRDRPPKLPPRPKNGVSRKPSGLSKASTSGNSQATPKKPAAKGKPSKDPKSTTTNNAATGNAQPSAKQNTSPKKAPSAKKPPPKEQPSAAKQLSSASKEAPKSRETAPKKSKPTKAPIKPKNQAAPERSVSDAQKPAPKQPPQADTSAAAQKPPPKLPPSERRKSSQAKLPRPPLKSAPSGRRVSFKDEVDQRPASLSNTPKLSDVSEGDSKPSAPPGDTDGAAQGDEQATSGSSKKAAAQPKKKQPPRKLPNKKAPLKKKTPPKTSRSQPTEGQAQDDTPEDKLDQTPVDKLAEDNRDLKSVLSEEECGDLTLLVADITRQMRIDIQSHFDAAKGLKLIKDDKTGDILEQDLDFDPGTVDVSAYDKERKLRDAEEKELAKPEVKKLKETNLEWYDEWREVVVLRVGEAVNSKQTASKQSDGALPKKTTSSRGAEKIQKFEAGSQSGASIGPKLEEIFPRIKTPLTKLPMNKRSLVLHSILLLLLSLEHYNAASRVLLLYLTTSLKLGLSTLRTDEEQTAQGLLHAAKALSAEVEARKHLEESATSSARKWKIRIATAAGAAVIGYTGGLAAPMIAAGVGSLMGDIGLGATAAAGYLGTVASNAAVVGGIFGAYGGRMTGQVMENISAGVQDFGFLPLHGERTENIESNEGENQIEAVTGTRRLRVVIAISGWLLEKEEVVTPWHVLKPSAEVFALRWELETLLNLGQSFDTMLQSAVYGYAQSAVVKRTVFSELMGGMMWPMALTKVARVVDNPFSLAKTRADKAGQVLADALINHVQGERPVTLIGYSLGARVIWSCLMTLAKKKAFGLVESAVLMGSPIPSDTNNWRLMRSAVVGRLVNVYSENDYLLAFLYRASSLQTNVAGIIPITGLAGIENVDVTELVSGHLRYRYLVGAILQKIRFEDVDKDEVAKEAEAFENVVDEEEKRTYFQQGQELYQTYKGKKPQPKQKKSGKPKMDISDADAEKQASEMEKTVEEKTEQSLMQWAAEQLYLSTPADKDKAKDPKKAAKEKEKIEKTTYEWAKESIALARSGGPKGEKVANKKKKDIAAKAKKTEKDAGNTKDKTPEEIGAEAGANYVPEDEDIDKTPTQAKQGYLSSAAGYMPSIRSSAPKKQAPNDTKTPPPTEEAADKAAKEAAGYSSYLPSMPQFGSVKGKGKEKAVDEPTEEAAEGDETQGEKPDEQEGELEEAGPKQDQDAAEQPDAEEGEESAQAEASEQDDQAEEPEGEEEQPEEEEEEEEEPERDGPQEEGSQEEERQPETPTAEETQQPSEQAEEESMYHSADQGQTPEPPEPPAAGDENVGDEPKVSEEGKAGEGDGNEEAGKGGEDCKGEEGEEGEEEEGGEEGEGAQTNAFTTDTEGGAASDGEDPFVDKPEKKGGEGKGYGKSKGEEDGEKKD